MIISPKQGQKGMPNMSKAPIMPKPRTAFILHDKEQLYDDAIKLKQSMNIFQDENVRLKAKISQYSKELEKKDKIIQELLGQVSAQPQAVATGFPKAQSTTHLVIALKKQLKDTKDEIRAKEDEIKKLKNSLKITRLQETEVEIKMFSDECTRLKHIIEEIVKQRNAGYSPEDVAMIEDKIVQQEALIKIVKQENTEITEAVKKKDEEISNWRDVSSKLQKRLLKLETESKENVKNRKQMADTKKEVQKLRDQLCLLKANNKDKEANAYKSRIEELLRRQAEINERLEQKEKKIKTIEAKLMDNPIKEKEREEEITQMRKKLKECEAEMAELKKQEKEQKLPPGIVKLVEKAEVKLVIEEIRLGLILERIDAKSIKSKMFDEYDVDEGIAICELARVLKRKPLKCKQDTVKLARYVIERRDKAELKFNEKVEERLNVVIERIVSMIGEYTVFDKDSEEFTKRSLHMVSFPTLFAHRN